MSEKKEKESILSKKALWVALAFGAATFLVKWAGLEIPIVGTNISTDPRELFVTIGGGLTGPIGGLMIGIMAGLGNINAGGGVLVSSILTHAAAGLWMGIAYKKLVYDRLQMPLFLLGWIGLVVAYYYIFLIPVFSFSLIFFYPALFANFFGKSASFWQACLFLVKGSWAEVALTAVITSVAMAVLPARYHRPLW